MLLFIFAASEIEEETGIMVRMLIVCIRWSSLFLIAFVLAACAELGLTQEAVSAPTEEQEQAFASGRNAYHVRKESYEHLSGKEVLYLSFDGVQFTDDAEKPLDRAHQFCHSTCVVSGLDGKCYGYCSAVDDDGDMWWISWDRLDEGGGTWSYLGGTGKYDGETGGGTWIAGGEHGPNMVSNFWKRTY